MRGWVLNNVPRWLLRRRHKVPHVPVVPPGLRRALGATSAARSPHSANSARGFGTATATRASQGVRPARKRPNAPRRSSALRRRRFATTSGVCRSPLRGATNVGRPTTVRRTRRPLAPRGAPRGSAPRTPTVRADTASTAPARRPWEPATTCRWPCRTGAFGPTKSWCEGAAHAVLQNLTSVRRPLSLCSSPGHLGPG